MVACHWHCIPVFVDILNAGAIRGEAILRVLWRVKKWVFLLQTSVY